MSRHPVSRHPHCAPCLIPRRTSSSSSPAVTRRHPPSPLSRYTAGDVSVDLYFIKSGMVEMKDCTGRYILCEHGDGEYFGDVRSPVHRFAVQCVLIPTDSHCFPMIHCFTLPLLTHIDASLPFPPRPPPCPHRVAPPIFLPDNAHPTLLELFPPPQAVEL
jgi:hypothetical protein